MWIYFLPRVLDFNPRPREEGDSFHCLYYTAPLYFNPRPREEGDKLSCDSIKFNKNISIHALVKRATYMPNIPFSPATHFNPRPREEGDQCGYIFYPVCWISIHALVKRATRFIVFIILRLCISIHALVKRATNYLVIA